jgi:hypothetical protein
VLKRLFLTAFFLEMGMVLIVIPWLAFWDRNYFAQVVPPLHGFMTNNFVRGAVSGLGLINVLVGLSELTALLLRRTPSKPVSINPSQVLNE